MATINKQERSPFTNSSSIKQVTEHTVVTATNQEDFLISIGDFEVRLSIQEAKQVQLSITEYLYQRATTRKD